MTRAAGRVLPVILVLCSALSSPAQQRDLTLDDALSLARRSSEAVRISQLSVEKSRLAVSEARGRMLPHVDLQASASYLVNPPPGYTVAAGALGSPVIPPNALGPGSPAIPLGPIPQSPFNVGAALHDYFTLSAALTQPLFTWGKIRNAIDVASLQADASATELSARLRSIDREVRRAYDALILARESQKVLRRITDTAADIVADRQKSLNDGTTNREAVLEVAANLASLRARLTEAEQSESSARESLGMLTGLDPALINPVTGFSSALPALEDQAVIARAVGGSTDLAGARSRSEQARRKLAIEQGGAILHPDVSLGVSFDVSGQEDFPSSGAWTFANNTWNIDLVLSLGVKMSAFDGMESLRRTQQAEKDVELADTALSQQARLVRLQARRGIEAAVTADAAVQEKQARADYRAEKLRNARVSWTNGLASRDDLRGADVLSGSADLELLLARYHREEAVADLVQLMGGAP